jgi:HlyD family secretion protein
MIQRVVTVSFGTAAILCCSAFFSSTSPQANWAPTYAFEASDPSQDQEPDNAVGVKTIRTRRDPNFGIAVEQPAYVQAYYQADLMARVAGPIRMIEVDIGDRVKAGQVLAQIDVPDLEEEVRQKEAIVKQRQQELELARANVKTAAARVEAATGEVQVKDAAVLKASADERFRGKELKRFQGLGRGESPAVLPDVIDERQLFYETAQAGVATARADVVKTKADLQEAQAKLEAARADVSLAEALVAVAQKDRDRVRALASYANITAPFDGVVTRRLADPGSFVMNAATAHTEPILTVARTDIVTLYMKVPDNYAPYVTRGTEAVIKLGVLRGWDIHAKVTRFSPSLESPDRDRTMRVEVDLFNGTREEFDRFLASSKAVDNAGLKGRVLPVFPEIKGRPTAGLDGRLLPGMFGKMRLVLRSFADAFLVPSTAVFSQGGRAYIYLVQDGKAVLTPVEIQVDDGKYAKILLLKGNRTSELTGEETIVASNQGELSDGQAVKASPMEW